MGPLFSLYKGGLGTVFPLYKAVTAQQPCCGLSSLYTSVLCQNPVVTVFLL